MLPAVLIEGVEYPWDQDTITVAEIRSLNDRAGIRDFAPYVQWKLGGKPFAALVWGENSLDGVMWHGDFKQAQRIDEVVIERKEPTVIIPRATWFEQRLNTWYGRSYVV